MRQHHRAFILAGLVVAAGCSDQTSLPTAPPSPDLAGTSSLAVAAQPQRVGAVGVVDQVNAQERTLVVLQTGLEFIPGKGVTVTGHELAIGSRNAKLQVVITPDTRIYLTGAEKTFADLATGTQVIVIGRAAGETLEATAITDLTPVEPPPGVREATRRRMAELSATPRLTSPFAAEEISWCVASDLDYPDVDVLEFQGCWGFPVTSDQIDVDVPFLWVLLGFLQIDYFTYTAGLSGENFAWPFRFSAKATSGLVYHVPGEILLGVEGLPGLPGGFTFSGGFGVDFGMNLDFCTIFGDCSDLETLHAGVGQTYESMGAPPTDTLSQLDIEEPTCLGMGVLPIKGFSPLSVSYCWDMRFYGRPFMADVRVRGTPRVPFAFQPGTYDMSVRPDSTALRVVFDHMSWKPPYTVGGYFTFEVFDFEVWRTPNLFNAPHDPMPFVVDPFPAPGLTLAHRRSGELVYQPTFIEFTLPVAPAPTQLAITSGPVVSQGAPVTVRLSEAFDQSAIPGQTVTIRAHGVGGTPSIEVLVTTDGSGIAPIILQPGQYHIVAEYDGAPTYEPSLAPMTSVVVYRPTTFVIWGGNSGGVTPGAKVQFWGRGWAKQLMQDGSYGGNASFQGFGLPFGENMWVSPPASSGREPATVPDVIGVIITTRVEGRGSNTVGNIAGYAVLRVEDPAAYQPNGGHAAMGVVLSTQQ